MDDLKRMAIIEKFRNITQFEQRDIWCDYCDFYGRSEDLIFENGEMFFETQFESRLDIARVLSGSSCYEYHHQWVKFEENGEYVVSSDYIDMLVDVHDPEFAEFLYDHYPAFHEA